MAIVLVAIAVHESLTLREPLSEEDALQACYEQPWLR
jgi:hypothetical protein